MPARLAISVVLVAWNPVAANALTAAPITCSRRSSELLRFAAAGLAMRLVDLIELSIFKQVTQHEVKDAVVPVVEPLVRRVDAHARLEVLALRGRHLDRPRAFLQRSEVEGLLAREPERLRRLAVRELKRQDPHADQVGAVDSLIRLGQHEAHSE